MSYKVIRVSPYRRSTRSLHSTGSVSPGSRRARSATTTAPGARTPARESRSAARPTNPLPYGGSRKTRSNVLPFAESLRPPPEVEGEADRAFRLQRREVRPQRVERDRGRLDDHRPGRPAGERLDRHRARSGEEVEHDPPLDVIPRIANTASRTRSVVGRTEVPRGARSVRPPHFPATTRTFRAARKPNACPRNLLRAGPTIIGILAPLVKARDRVSRRERDKLRRMIGHPFPLRVGRIPYANLVPIFHGLATGDVPGGVSYVDGHPSELNRKLRNGELDLSPSSSIEYAVHPDRYLLCPAFPSPRSAA